MISMSQVHSIRLLRREGETIAGIARKVGVSRTTVHEKLREGDCSPKMPVKQHKHRMLDDYRAIIEGWLDEDSRNWRKQRHTARRIWQRLRNEYGVRCSESTVRHYVCELKRTRRKPEECFLDLVAHDAQAVGKVALALAVHVFSQAVGDGSPDLAVRPGAQLHGEQRQLAGRVGRVGGRAAVAALVRAYEFAVSGEHAHSGGA